MIWDWSFTDCFDLCWMSQQLKLTLRKGCKLWNDECWIAKMNSKKKSSNKIFKKFSTAPKRVYDLFSDKFKIKLNLRLRSCASHSEIWDFSRFSVFVSVSTKRRKWEMRKKKYTRSRFLTLCFSFRCRFFLCFSRSFFVKTSWNFFFFRRENGKSLICVPYFSLKINSVQIVDIKRIFRLNRIRFLLLAPDMMTTIESDLSQFKAADTFEKKWEIVAIFRMVNKSSRIFTLSLHLTRESLTFPEFLSA